MLSWLIRPVRQLARALAASPSPRQVALGFALGMMLGLVPKGNLVAVSLSVLLLATRVNLAAGMMAATIFSWAGTVLDPVSHRIGLELLTADALHSAWTRLFDLPYMPWTHLHNTVVLGSLVLGICCFYPVYVICRRLYERFQPRVFEKIRKYKVTKVLLGADVATSWRIG